MKNKDQRNQWNLFSKNLLYTLSQHFWDTQYRNIFFAFFKKIFLQTQVEIIFRYHFFLKILGSPYKRKEQK